MAIQTKKNACSFESILRVMWLDFQDKKNAMFKLLPNTENPVNCVIF